MAIILKSPKVSAVPRVRSVNPPAPIRQVPTAIVPREVPQAPPVAPSNTNSLGTTSRRPTQTLGTSVTTNTRNANDISQQPTVEPEKIVHIEEEPLSLDPPEGLVPYVTTLDPGYIEQIFTGHRGMDFMDNLQTRYVSKPGNQHLLAYINQDDVDYRGMYYPVAGDVEKYDFYVVVPIDGKMKKIPLSDFMKIDENYKFLPDMLSNKDIIASSALRAAFEHGKQIDPNLLEDYVQYAHKHKFNPHRRGPFDWHEPAYTKGRVILKWDATKQQFVNINEKGRREYRKTIVGTQDETVYRPVYDPTSKDYNLTTATRKKDGVHNMMARFPRGFRYYDGSVFGISHTSTDSTPLLWGRVSRAMGNVPGKMFADFIRNSDGSILQISTNQIGDSGVYFNDLMKDPETKKLLSKAIGEDGNINIRHLSEEDSNLLSKLILSQYEKIGIETADNLKKVFSRMVEKDPRLKEGLDLITPAAYDQSPQDMVWDLLASGVVKVPVNIPAMMFGKHRHGGKFYSNLNFNKV